MNISEILQQDLDFNQALVEELNPYADRKVSDLPDAIKKKLYQIKTGPKITFSGLESVKSILTNLSLVNAFLKQAIKNPSEFMKTYSEEKPATNSPQPTTHNFQPSTNNQKQTTVNSQPSTINGQQSTINKKPKTTTLNPSTNIKLTTINKQLSTPQTYSGQATNTPPPASKIEL